MARLCIAPELTHHRHVIGKMNGEWAEMSCWAVE